MDAADGVCGREQGLLGSVRVVEHMDVGMRCVVAQRISRFTNFALISTVKEKSDQF